MKSGQTFVIISKDRAQSFKLVHSSVAIGDYVCLYQPKKRSAEVVLGDLPVVDYEDLLWKIPRPDEQFMNDAVEPELSFVSFCRIVKSNEIDFTGVRNAIDPRGLPQYLPVVITIFTHVVGTYLHKYICPSVRTYFIIQQQSHLVRTVGWPSGSFMTRVLFNLLL